MVAVEGDGGDDSGGGDDDDNSTSEAGDSHGDWCLTARDALKHVDVLCSFVANAKSSEQTAAFFFTFQKNLFLDFEKEKVQCKLTSYCKVAQ